ncbi:MAG: hypothetical protein EPN97_17290 [Alphaproteobacteria bacterium]|nr:MAG: hypothetical protein EPN97_17290 [Alphaproteobacteria bacterium]
MSGWVLYRSAAWLREENGEQKLFFWVIAPCWERPGCYIREYAHGVTTANRRSGPITKDLTEREAFLQMTQIEAENDAKYPRVDDKDPKYREKLDDDYIKSPPFREHPIVLAECRQEQLDELKRKREKAGLKLRP